jgi:hypothetical protein
MNAPHTHTTKGLLIPTLELSLAGFSNPFMAEPPDSYLKKDLISRRLGYPDSPIGSIADSASRSGVGFLEFEL